MKWFKHFSDSLDDSFIQDLMDEHSHLGYAVWFGLLEIIAAENGSKLTGKVQLKPSFLRRKLRTSQAKLREVLEYCQSNGRLLADFSQERWELEVPKMLDLKDNYIKDLQVAGKKPSKHKEVEEEAEKEEEKKVTKETPASPDGSPDPALEIFDSPSNQNIFSAIKDCSYYHLLGNRTVLNARMVNSLIGYESGSVRLSVIDEIIKADAHVSKQPSRYRWSSNNSQTPQQKEAGARKSIGNWFSNAVRFKEDG